MAQIIHNTIVRIGGYFSNFLIDIGRFTLFIFEALFFNISKIYPKKIINNIIYLGYCSLPVVGITAIFTGAVLALQSYSGFSRFSAESAIATVVVLSITRELGPVLAGLMVCARVGASITAEIATMKVTEQIDALYTLQTNPIKYLVTPRIIAMVISLPILVIIADIIGVMGGYLIATEKLGFIKSVYLQNTFKYLKFDDVMSGLIKSVIFGFIISSVSCFQGFNSERGAQGVGNATTKSVVISSILILLFNYLVTQLTMK